MGAARGAGLGVAGSHGRPAAIFAQAAILPVKLDSPKTKIRMDKGVDAKLLHQSERDRLTPGDLRHDEHAALSEETREKEARSIAMHAQWQEALHLAKDVLQMHR
eukprot:3598670-Pyramimonas_sp.AAC.1